MSSEFITKTFLHEESIRGCMCVLVCVFCFALFCLCVFCFVLFFCFGGKQGNEKNTHYLEKDPVAFIYTFCLCSQPILLHAHL